MSNARAKIEAVFSSRLKDPQTYPLDWFKKFSKNNVDKENQNKHFSVRHCAVRQAVIHKRLDILEWLVVEEKCPVDIRPLDQHPVITAIEIDQMDALKWLLEKNAADNIQGYCVEACIHYDNLAALQCLLKDGEFAIALEKKSFMQKADSSILFNENVTSLMIKFNCFEMLLWLLSNHENVFRDDIRDKTVNVMPNFYEYLQTLDEAKLNILRTHLSVAFNNLEMSTDGDAIKIIDKIDLMTSMPEHSTPPTPTWVPRSPFALGSSPKKQSYLNSQLLWSKISSLADNVSEIPEEYDVIFDVNKHFATSNNIVIPVSRNTRAQAVSPMSTSPKKLAHFNTSELWAKVSLLKIDDALEVNENLEIGSYKQ